MNADMFQFSKFQDMARDWIRFKTMLQIIVMLAFSLVVQCFTDLNVVASSIGMTGVGLYILAVHLPEFDRAFLIAQLKKRLIEEKLILGLTLTLALDLPWLSVVSLAIWAWYFRNLWLQSKKGDGQLVFMPIICLQYELILVRYDEFITIRWGFLVFLLFLPTAFGLIVFYLYGLPLLKNKDPTPVFPAFTDDWDDDYDDVNYIETRIRSGKLVTILFLSLGFLYTTAILQCYIPTGGYRIMILIAFGWVLVELLGMVLCKRELSHYWNLTYFSLSVCVRTSWNRLRMSYSEKSTYNIPPPLSSIPDPACLFCQEKAVTAHFQGDNITFGLCLSCVKQKPAKLCCPPSGKYCSNRWSILSKDLPFLSSSYKQTVKSFLYAEQYLIGIVL